LTDRAEGAVVALLVRKIEARGRLGFPGTWMLLKNGKRRQVPASARASAGVR
jgi:hypothetical protein